jgi:hypothetical protein
MGIYTPKCSMETTQNTLIWAPLIMASSGLHDRVKVNKRVPLQLSQKGYDLAGMSEQNSFNEPHFRHRGPS